MKALNFDINNDHKQLMQRKLNLVTECSGMEAPLLALRELGFRVQHHSSTDYASGPQKFIARIPPEINGLGYNKIRMGSVLSNPTSPSHYIIDMCDHGVDGANSWCDLVFASRITQHTHIHTHTHTHTLTHTHTSTHTHRHTHTGTHARTRAHAHTHTHVHAHAHAHAPHTHTQAHTHICKHSRTHTPKPRGCQIKQRDI